MTQHVPADTAAAFGTLCGGTAVMLRAPAASSGTRYTWTCLGCHDGDTVKRAEEPTRRAVNAHAGVCRSMPFVL